MPTGRKVFKHEIMMSLDEYNKVVKSDFGKDVPMEPITQLQTDSLTGQQVTNTVQDKDKTS